MCLDNPPSNGESSSGLGLTEEASGILRRVLESPPPGSMMENDENSSPRGIISSTTSEKKLEESSSRSTPEANKWSSAASFYSTPSPAGASVSTPSGVSPAPKDGMKTRLKTYSFRRTRSSPLGTHNASSSSSSSSSNSTGCNPCSSSSKPYAPPPKSRLSLFPSSSERLKKKNNTKALASHRVGFPNIYQTCYLNAILQCLLSQPSFLSSLLELKAKASGRIPALLRSFCSLAEAKEEGNQSIVSKEILKLKNILSNLDSTFKGSSMQDADEFLLKFCDTLREQCKSLLHESDPITENIEHEMETIVTCSSCGFRNSTSSKNLICTLNSPNSERRDSLGGLIQKTFSSSRIQPWSCETCGVKDGSATLSSYFKTLPRVLIFHVPRSNYDSLSDVKNQKIKLAIRIFEHLNLASVAVKEVAFPDRRAAFRKQEFLDDEDEDDELLSSGQTHFPSTPEKLKNLSMEQIGKLNEEDSLALAIRFSLKETGGGANTGLSEDAQMRAAVDQSMADEETPPESKEPDIVASELDARKSDSISYQLASIVSHLGSSASSGHYIADVFRFDRNAWFRYNDMNVFKRSADCVRSDENMRNGYLFIYTHCQLLPDS